MMKNFLRSAAAVLAVTGATAAQETTPSQMSEEELRAMHESLLTLDTHIDIGPRYASPFHDPGTMTFAQVDLPGMRAGGLDAGVFIAFIPQAALDEDGYKMANAIAERKFQAIRKLTRAYPDDIGFARTADEVRDIVAQGRRVSLLGMENAYPLGESVEDVPLWAERGLVYMGLTHFGNNQFGDSSNPASDEPQTDEGLTDLGRDLVQALNENGILVDISHVGPKTAAEAMELSTTPVIASHSGAAGVYENPRNLTDDQLRAIAEDGGVAQMVAFRSYVGEVAEAVSAATAELAERYGLTTSAAFEDVTPDRLAEYEYELDRIRDVHDDIMLQDFVDHIDHAVEVAGIDHVGVSGDFDGGGGVGGWDNASESLNVTRELVARGYSEDEIAKLWGGNFLRVLETVSETRAD